MRSMNAVSLRISGGSGPKQVADALLVLDVHVEVADHHDEPSARMLSLPRLNSPDSM
jgi:hypothetical protein